VGESGGKNNFYFKFYIAIYKPLNIDSVVSGACVVSAAINKSLVSRSYWSQRDKYLAAAFKSGDEGVKMTPQSISLSNGFPLFVYLGPCSIPLDQGVRDFYEYCD
jgi:hypothetical protein